MLLTLPPLQLIAEKMFPFDPRLDMILLLLLESHTICCILANDNLVLAARVLDLV